MNYQTMTKKELIIQLEKNEILKPVKSINDITFGHLRMVENIGLAVADEDHNFKQVLSATWVVGNLTITLPTASEEK